MLDGQSTLYAFERTVEQETRCTFELRGANPTLVSPYSYERDIRFCRMGLRQPFWLKLVTDWTTDFAQIADEQGADVLPHLWRGLVGQRLTPEQRLIVRGFAKQAGVVEVAQALCAAVDGSPENAPSAEVFQRFCERSRAIIEERQKQGLPPAAVKRPKRTSAMGHSRQDRLLGALGIGSRELPCPLALPKRQFRGLWSRTWSSPAMPGRSEKHTIRLAPNLRLTEHGIVSPNADPN